MLTVDDPQMKAMACHHVALRCADSRETIEFYTEVLGMKFTTATRERLYRGKPLDFVHLFLEMADGHFMAFFEVPELEGPSRIPDSPDWTTHFALQFPTRSAVERIKELLIERGVVVDGPVYRAPYYSIYFKDPNGHRLEATALDAHHDGVYRNDPARAAEILRDWEADMGRAAEIAS